MRSSRGLGSANGFGQRCGECPYVGGGRGVAEREPQRRACVRLAAAHREQYMARLRDPAEQAAPVEQSIPAESNSIKMASAEQPGKPMLAIREGDRAPRLGRTASPMGQPRALR